MLADAAAARVRPNPPIVVNAVGESLSEVTVTVEGVQRFPCLLLTMSRQWGTLMKAKPCPFSACHRAINRLPIIGALAQHR